MKKIIRVVTVLFLLYLPSAGINAQTQEEVRQQANKLAQTLYYINALYNDNVDNIKLTDEAIAKIMSQLDPHSVYVTAKDAKAMNEPLEGNFEGIGVEFTIIRDTISIVNPIAGGPSERVGILAGDKIVSIENEKVAGVGITNEKVFKLLKGPKGTRVNISVLREGRGLLNFEIVRDRIPINSLDACYEVAPGIVYFKLSRFSATSTEEIKKGISDLKLKNIKGIVADLRGNGGGFLNTAIEIVDMFLDKDQTIVYTEGRRSPRRDTFASGEGLFKNVPLAVLIDEGSASASEIFSGAIQDWDRGAIIGRRSFGKGLVQQMIPFNDGSLLRLTIARYHTPSGRVIQKPFVAGNKESYYMDLNNRYESGELFHEANRNLPDSLKYKTLKLGRTVYGGGGISPDVFIPADTSDFSPFLLNIIRKGIQNEYVNDYVNKNRDELKREYKTFNTFNKEFNPDNLFMDKFYSYAESRGVAKDVNGVAASEERLKNYIKALMARSLFDGNAYFRVVNSYKDKELDAALGYLNGGLKVF
jgi:carboxyl-terminal processing protease